MHRRRLLLLAGTILAAVPTLDGCGGISGPPGGAENPAAATVEYRHEESRFTLAPGWQWQADPERSTGPNGKPQYYEPGAAKADADIYWWCTWAAYLTTSAGVRSPQTPLLELRSVFRTYFYQRALAPSDRAGFRSIVTDAERRSYGRIRQFVAANCASPGASGAHPAV
jgi:hypothetical protein